MWYPKNCIFNKSYQHFNYYYGSYYLVWTNSILSISFTFPNKLITCIIVSFPFYRWEHCDPEKLTNLPKVLHLEIDETRNRIQFFRL